MKNLNLKWIAKNKLLIVVALTYVALAFYMPVKAVKSAQNSMYYIIEMLEIMPVILVLTSLIEAWVPKEVIMKNLGEGSGKKGALISFLLGSISAGPVYAAFPVCKMLLKKGAGVFNIVVILSAWAVIKVPMLANEAKFLGVKFMGIRWIFTTLAIFIIAWLVAAVVKKEEMPVSSAIGQKAENRLCVNESYCVGCGLCIKMCPQGFQWSEGKAKAVVRSITPDLLETIQKVAQKCPAKSIDF